jgi:hypothetical protein
MKSSILVFLIACGGLAPKAGETLGDSVRSYNDGVRWGRFEVAASHIPPKQRPTWVDQADARAKDLKITDYDVVSVNQRTDREAHVHIKLEWYKDSEGTVRETHAMQTWERHGKDWLIVDEARLRGAEMPGLPEPLSTGSGAGAANN